MNSKQKQKKLNRNISIVLAVLIVATLCVTIAALTAAKRKDDDTQKPHQSSSSQSTPLQSNSSQSTPPQSSSSSSSSSGSGSSAPAIKVVEWHSPAVGNVIKEYSSEVPVFSVTMEDYRTHMGIDISGDAGSDVLAAADGVIDDVYYDPMMGQTIIITHENGYTSIYQNLQTHIPEGIEAGAKVKGGEKIGAMGDTALIEISDSPHLHFCVKLDGKYTDPLSFVTVSAPANSIDYEDKGA